MSFIAVGNKSMSENRFSMGKAMQFTCGIKKKKVKED